MISLSKPIIGEEEKKAVRMVLDSGYIVEGKQVKDFETRFAKLCGAKYAIAVNNGTSALHTTLYSIGIQPGDEIITTPFTFVATANSILMVSAKPVFVDIDSKTFNIDSNLIEKSITKKTRAILTVDLYGQPADYSTIRKIAKKHKLIIVEDAAQSVNAEYNGKKTGNLADISCFSLYATKNIMCGEGGIITTNNRNYFEKARQFRNHGQPYGLRYIYKDIGYNYRMMNIQATIALEQLKRLDYITKRRQKIAQQYNKELSAIRGIQIPFTASNRTHVYHQYTLRITKECKVTRNEFKKFLFEKGIQSNIYYPIPLYDFKHLKYKIGKCINTEKAVQEVISIPIHPSLTDKEVEFIITIIKNI